MLVYKARQVIVATRNEPKEWEMNGRKGTSHTATIAVLGEDMRVSNLKIKGQSVDDLNAKVAALTIGKPYDFRVINIEHLYKVGDDGKRKADYEFVVDVQKPAQAKAA